MEIVKLKKSPGPSGTFQDDVVRKVKELGQCDLFHIKKHFPQAKLASIQRALDINKFKGFLRIVRRDNNFRIPMGGDLRSLTTYTTTDLADTSLPPSPTEFILMQQRQNQANQQPVTRAPNMIERCAAQAINARTGLELVWPKVLEQTGTTQEN